MQGMDARDFYDELGSSYDTMVSWAGRLEREELFFRSVFDTHGVRRVLDAACGTGMHAVAFALQGRTAAGADISPVMIAQAQANARRAGVDVQWKVAGFGGLSRLFEQPFDAVTCLGNSLPHIPDDEALASALSDFARLLRPGGLLVIQDRNYDRVLASPGRSVHLNAREEPDGETLFVRMTEPRGGDAVDFSILTLRKRAGAWSADLASTPLRAITRADMEKALARAGFTAVEVYGDYSRAAYGAPKSGDLVVVARMPGGAPASRGG
jgi:glycine/sarcosine N-methyltransferase